MQKGQEPEFHMEKNQQHRSGLPVLIYYMNIIANFYFVKPLKFQNLCISLLINVLVLSLLNYNCSISSVQLLSRVRLFEATRNAACQTSLSIISSQSLLKLMSIELLMPSNHLSLCHPFLLLPSIFPSIRVFSNESVLHIRWPKYWSFSFSISPSNEYSGMISFRID